MTNARCWVALPSSLPPHHLPLSGPPPPFRVAGGGGGGGLSPPPSPRPPPPPGLLTPFAQAAPLGHPLCVPPLVARTPIPLPHPFRANGDVNGVGCTLLPLVRGPPRPVSPCPLPCLALPCLARPASPCPPSALRTCQGRRRDSASSPFPSVHGQWCHLPWLHPTPAACPPPPLHARWRQGGKSVLPPFLFARRPLCPGCSLPAYALPAACVPSPTLCSDAGGGTGGTMHTHPSVHPSTQAMPPPSPRLRCASPLPIFSSPLHPGHTSSPPI